MKKTINFLIAASIMATQMFAANAIAAEESKIAQLKDKAVQLIKQQTINAGTSFNLFSISLDDYFKIDSGIRYRYLMENDMGKYLREDRWTDYVQANISMGPVAIDRSIRRDMAFGRFFDDWFTGLKTFLFSPLDLKGLNSKKIKDKLMPGDMTSVTLEKGTFLGLRGAVAYNNVTLDGSAGKVFVGKIVVKLLRKADNKVTITFANADESTMRFAVNVRIQIIPGFLSMKFLGLDEQFWMRGTAHLATYTYDLNNERATAALDKLLAAIDSPTILLDEEVLKEGISLDTRMSSGILDVTPSEIASADVTSGVVKEQKLVNKIVDGRRSHQEFNLIPSLLGSSKDRFESINLVDVELSGTFIKPGQYIIGYRTNNENENFFLSKNSINNMTSVVYRPDPFIADRTKAKGYRGLHDLVGISYHTDAEQTENAKELVTYSKLCNAGVIKCPAPIKLRVVDPDSADAMSARIDTKLPREHNNSNAPMAPASSQTINSNYFVSHGLFEKIKERMNWNYSSQNQREDMIRQAIAPVIKEMVLPGKDHKNRDLQDIMVMRMTDFLNEVLENDCYSNLIGLKAQNQKNIWKSLFTEKCGTELYNVSDEVVRLNMPLLLISMYDPSLLPPASEPNRKASAEQLSELAKYFSVVFNTNYRTTGDSSIMRSVSGAQFGAMLFEANDDNKAAQVIEFTNLISVWARQQNMDLDYFDRTRMLKEKQ